MRPVDLEIDISDLDETGRGIAYVEGKRIHVEDALPGERVRVDLISDGPYYAIGRRTALLRTSPQRVTPACPHFGVCGGCSVQHLAPAAQVAIKQRRLEAAFARVNVRPDEILPPIHGPAWGYRTRARLTVRVVPSKGGVLLGFHERNSSYVADILVCPIMPAQIASLLPPLHGLIAQMSTPNRVPQIEAAVDEDDSVVLVLRHLVPLAADDHALLKTFGEEHGVRWWLQPGGPDTIHPLHGGAPYSLHYPLPDFQLRMPFRPTDFIQINPHINRILIRRALQLLSPRPADRIADFFCGLGNFTLPLARHAAEVVGVEGSPKLLERAAQAASIHGLSDRIRYEAADLFQIDAAWLEHLGRFDSVLLDPPREGALALCRALSALPSDHRPQHIVYVSCNPATLARDAAVLVHQGQYRLAAIEVANMFPQTNHVESIASFVPQQAH